MKGLIETMTVGNGDRLGICRGDNKFRYSVPYTHMLCGSRPVHVFICRFTYLEPSKEFHMDACLYLPVRIYTPAGAGYEGKATIEIATLSFM